MNSITRLILRGVVSGNVPLTPQVLGALKTASQDHPRVDGPVKSANESATHTDESNGGTLAPNKPLTIMSPRTFRGVAVRAASWLVRRHRVPVWAGWDLIPTRSRSVFPTRTGW